MPKAATKEANALFRPGGETAEVVVVPAEPLRIEYRQPKPTPPDAAALAWL